MSTPEAHFEAPVESIKGTSEPGFMRKLFSILVQRLPEDMTPQEFIETDQVITSELGGRGENL